jgi:hypothetical protein
MFDAKAFNKTFMQECYNKPSCNLDLIDKRWFGAAPKNMSICGGSDTRIYLQVGCTLRDSEIQTNKKIGLFAVFLMLIVSAVFYERIREYMRNRRAQKTRNDFMNCTIGDYSIRIDGIEPLYK